MLSTWIQSKKDEEGFTLIELLVVVIIIGILAAIAIPVFLSQRENAWQAELTSTVRNAAIEAESAATTAGGSYEGIEQADVTGFANTVQGTDTDPVTLTLVTATAEAFVICGTHNRLVDDGDPDGSIVYNSQAGGLQDFVEGGDCAP